MDSVAQRLSVVGAGAALELRGVTRLFGALAALTDVTITVRPGERRAVLGSNGAGKNDAVQLHYRRLSALLRHDPLLRRGHHPIPSL
ncbi:ABC-type molybdenum transport system ATPase subunit/photorepair protein PhrA [Bradyrhizobium elkanii]